MDLNNAIDAHAQWKTKFRAAITGKQAMDAATISKDNCCDLGKWLHGEGKTKCGSLPGHADCVRKHAAFHVEAGKVASAINAKNYSQAESMLASGTSYASASSAVGVAIMQLKKAAAL
ncbi:MAG: CZB domain-containing protein [Thiobacillus sp.]